jgi:hypothetical protein
MFMRCSEKIYMKTFLITYIEVACIIIHDFHSEYRYPSFKSVSFYIIAQENTILEHSLMYQANELKEFQEHASKYDPVLKQDKKYNIKEWSHSIDVEFYLCSVKCIYFVNKNTQNINCMVSLLDYTRTYLHLRRYIMCCNSVHFKCPLCIRSSSSYSSCLFHHILLYPLNFLPFSFLFFPAHSYLTKHLHVNIYIQNFFTVFISRSTHEPFYSSQHFQILFL